MSDYADTSHLPKVSKCIVCGDDTNGKYGPLFVCQNCYDTGAAYEWVIEYRPDLIKKNGVK